jgi:hypothetical protein
LSLIVLALVEGVASINLNSLCAAITAFALIFKGISS